MKKTIYVLLCLTFGLIIFFIGYFVHEKSVSGNKEATISRFTKPQEIRSPYDLLNKLPSENSSYPILSSNGREITYYNPSDGYLYTISLSGQKMQNRRLQHLAPYLKDLVWSHDGKLIIAT